MTSRNGSIALLCVAALAGCLPSQPSGQASGQGVPDAVIDKQISDGVIAAFPVALTECLRFIEKGTISEANLTSVGFAREGGNFGPGFVVDVSDPVQRTPVIFGPYSISVDFQNSFGPTCKMSAPARSNSTATTVATAAATFAENGYSFEPGPRGVFRASKGGDRVTMTVVRQTSSHNTIEIR